MGAFIPCPNIAEIVMRYTASSETVENVFHVKNTAGWTTAGLGATLIAFDGWENASCKAHRGTNNVLVEVLGRDLTTQNGAEAQLSTSRVGTDGGGHLPNNATIAIKASTGVAGRSFRGRTFWVGVTPTMLDPGGQTLTALAQANLVSAMDDLITAVNAGTTSLVVLSRRFNKAPRAAGIGTPIINYVLADGIMDSQRRRLPGHNRHR